MTDYLKASSEFTQKNISLFTEILADKNKLKDASVFKDASSHAICRAFALRYPEVQCADGYFYRMGHHHSWLTINNSLIIDICPVASYTPLFVSTSEWTYPWFSLYGPKANLLSLYLSDADIEKEEKTAFDIYKYLENFDQSHSWIDQKALDLALQVAKEVTITDPVWISRIQLAIIDGIKSGIRKDE